jgi:hypothetical protein
MQTDDRDDVNPDEMRLRFRENFDGLFKNPAKPTRAQIHAARLRWPRKPVTATPDKKSLSNKET